jgi:RNase H-fold protein (predicted Holliday junction resolvase)
MEEGIDVEFVREMYQKMNDKDIVRVLTQDANGLTAAAMEVVKEEIKRRKLNDNILRGVEAQQRTYTAEEIHAYCEIIQQLPCPVTGSTAEKLNATLTAEVTSFLLFSESTKKIVIGSPWLLDKANNRALTKTLLFGWWEFPRGFIKSVEAIRINIKSKKSNRLGMPTDYLKSFVLSKIGEIETYKEDKVKLLEIISG